MITNSGKGIIAKYLLGQAPAYASYIAVGCGKKPLSLSDSIPDLSNQTNLDFEMFRVPITSRGYVVEDNLSKIVFTAELPTEERYEITEVGLYSAGSNASAASYDSKTILAFTDTENWTKQDGSVIPTISQPLDGSNNDNIIDINLTGTLFKSNADNRIFYNINRSNRYERCRYFNNMIGIAGNTSEIEVDVNNHLSVNSSSEYIKLNGISLDFSKNTPLDELRLAFSVINRDGTANSIPQNVKIVIVFTGSDENKFAKFEAFLENGTQEGQQDFINNRYCIVKKQLQELEITENFTWDSVNTVNIYCSAEYNNAPSNDFYILLDALRFENISTYNPLYGLTGYSIIQNEDSAAILKSPNTSNYIEFRFGIGVS